jgi:hypothetical protein
MSASAITENTAKSLGRNIVKLKYDKNGNCSLCLKEMKNTKVQITRCGHTFHSSCLEQQYKSNYKHKKKCSLCREELTEDYKKERGNAFCDSYIKYIDELLDMYEDIYNLYVKIKYDDDDDDDDANNKKEQFICDMNKKINIMNKIYYKLCKLCVYLVHNINPSAEASAEMAVEDEAKEYKYHFITTYEDIEKPIKQIEEIKLQITLRNDNITQYASNNFSTESLENIIDNIKYCQRIEKIIYEDFLEKCDEKKKEIRDYPYIYVLNVQ